jgi:hypothetical protein
MSTEKLKGIEIPSFSFIGKLASGKTTYADNLKEALEKEFQIPVYKVSTSAIVAEVALRYYGEPNKNRGLYQKIANKMKEIDPKVLANCIIRDVKENNKLPFIIDSVRDMTDYITLKRAFPKLVTIKLDADFRLRCEFHKEKYGEYPLEVELEDLSERTINSIPSEIKFQNMYKPENISRLSSSLIRSIRNGTIMELLRH